MSLGTERRKSLRGSLKEKVVQIYDKFFEGQDITHGQSDFWSDFFLLKVNFKYLMAQFERLAGEDLDRLKPQINRLLLECIQTAENETHRIRVANAIQTFSAILAGLYRCKQSPKLYEDVLVFTLGSENLKDFMQRYLSVFTDMFYQDRPDRLRELALNSLLILITACPSLHHNPLMQWLLDDRLFDLFRDLIATSHLRHCHGLSVCQLLGLIMQYRKFETQNLFQWRIGVMDDEPLLNGVSSTISLALSDFNTRYRQQNEMPGGFLSSVTSIFGSLLVGDLTSNLNLRPQNSLLLCLYEVLKTSAHFSTLLAYSHTHGLDGNSFETLSVTGLLREQSVFRKLTAQDSLGSPDSQSFLSVGDSGGDKSGSLSDDGQEVTPESHGHTMHRTAATSSEGGQKRIDFDGHLLTADKSQPACVPESNGNDHNLDDTKLPTNHSSHTTMHIPVVPSSTGSGLSVNPPTSLEPRNLLADLLEYSSIMTLDVKTPHSVSNCHLCFNILLCLVENPLSCSILHDPHINFKVRLHKSRRCRKSSPNTQEEWSSGPIAIVILDLMVEFLRSHLMKKLPHRLYRNCLIVCRKLLCYQRNHKIRLDFDWKQLWSALLNLLRFAVNLDSGAVELMNLLIVLMEALELFNIFILFGDSFLQAAEVYDELYYELIRMRELIEHVHNYALQHALSSDENIKTLAEQVVIQLANLRSIVNYFGAKIAAFQASNSLTSLTEFQVLAVVRDNYDSLTLRLHEDLDTVKTYDEPVEVEIFSNLVGYVVNQLHNDCLDAGAEMQNYFTELSVIS